MSARTASQRAAAKLYAGGIVSARELLSIEDRDLRLEVTPRSWRGRIKNLADLKNAIRYETDADGYEWLTINLRYPYRIEAGRINTVPRLFWWIAHLCEKTWMTREALSVLIKVVGERNGIKWGAAT